jgi:hypothetical protein
MNKKKVKATYNLEPREYIYRMEPGMLYHKKGRLMHIEFSELITRVEQSLAKLAESFVSRTMLMIRKDHCWWM